MAKPSQPSSHKLSIGLSYDGPLANSYTDGVVQYIRELGLWLTSRGHDVRFLAGQSEVDEYYGLKVYSLSKNLTMRWGGNRVYPPLYPHTGRIKRLLAERHFDVIHTQLPNSPFLGKIIVNHAKPETVVVGTFHVFPANKLAAWGTKIIRPLYGHSLRRHDKLLSASPAAQQYAKEGFGLQSQVVPNMVNVKRFAGAKRRANDQPTIVFLGRLVERKGCEYLLRAFARAADEIPDAHLVIAGDGPLRNRLDKLSRDLHVHERVDFLGFIDEKDKASILANAKVACFPSLYGECFGIVLIEAMAAGAGVVLGGHNPGYASVLGAQPKMLVNPKDTAIFAKRLVELISDEDESKRLHDWQTAEVKKYDVPVVGQRVLDVYYEAIASRRSSRHN